jgi:Signal transduction histidine kinase
LLKTDSDERLNRALTAFLRQEVQAPATAVTDFLDMLIEDARTAQAENLLADLNRMRSASVQLNAFVKSLVQDSSSDRRQDDETLEAFHRRLRHDLRTPLNAIKGYSELLIEDLEAAGAHPLLADLAKLKASADQLLEQIDAMTALARQKQAEPVELAKCGSLMSLPMCCARSSRCRLAPRRRGRCIRVASSWSMTMLQIAMCWSAG